MHVFIGMSDFELLSLTLCVIGFLQNATPLVLMECVTRHLESVNVMMAWIAAVRIILYMCKY